MTSYVSETPTPQHKYVLISSHQHGEEEKH